MRGREAGPGLVDPAEREESIDAPAPDFTGTEELEGQAGVLMDEGKEAATETSLPEIPETERSREQLITNEEEQRLDAERKERDGVLGRAVDYLHDWAKKNAEHRYQGPWKGKFGELFGRYKAAINGEHRELKIAKELGLKDEDGRQIDKRQFVAKELKERGIKILKKTGLVAGAGLAGLVTLGLSPAALGVFGAALIGSAGGRALAEGIRMFSSKERNARMETFKIKTEMFAKAAEIQATSERFQEELNDPNTPKERQAEIQAYLDNSLIYLIHMAHERNFKALVSDDETKLLFDGEEGSESDKAKDVNTAFNERYKLERRHELYSDLASAVASFGVGKIAHGYLETALTGDAKYGSDAVRKAFVEGKERLLADFDGDGTSHWIENLSPQEMAEMANGNDAFMKSVQESGGWVFQYNDGEPVTKAIGELAGNQFHALGSGANAELFSTDVLAKIGGQLRAEDIAQLGKEFWWQITPMMIGQAAMAISSAEAVIRQRSYGEGFNRYREDYWSRISDRVTWAKNRLERAKKINEIINAPTPTEGSSSPVKSGPKEKDKSKSSSEATTEKSEQMSEEERRLSEFVEEYLVYKDVKFDHLPKADADYWHDQLYQNLERVRSGELKESERRYAQSLQELFDQEKKEVVLGEAKALKKEVFDTLREIDPTWLINPFTYSQSWALWDMAKQHFYLTHPEEIMDGYTAGDPIHDAEKRSEMVSRHLGWEIYSNRQSFEETVNQNPALKRALDKSGQADQINALLNKDPKENNDLSSKDLARLGDLIRSVVSGVEEKIELEEASPSLEKTVGKEKATKLEQTFDDLYNSIINLDSATLDKARVEINHYTSPYPPGRGKESDKDGENYARERVIRFSVPKDKDDSTIYVIRQIPVGPNEWALRLSIIDKYRRPDEEKTRIQKKQTRLSSRTTFSYNRASQLNEVFSMILSSLEKAAGLPKIETPVAPIDEPTPDQPATEQEVVAEEPKQERRETDRTAQPTKINTQEEGSRLRPGLRHVEDDRDVLEDLAAADELAAEEKSPAEPVERRVEKLEPQPLTQELLDANTSMLINGKGEFKYEKADINGLVTLYNFKSAPRGRIPFSNIKDDVSGLRAELGTGPIQYIERRKEVEPAPDGVSSEETTDEAKESGEATWTPVTSETSPEKTEAGQTGATSENSVETTDSDLGRLGLEKLEDLKGKTIKLDNAVVYITSSEGKLDGELNPEEVKEDSELTVEDAGADMIVMRLNGATLTVDSAEALPHITEVR